MNERFKERLVRLMREKQVYAMMIAPSEELRFLAGFNVYQDERFQALFLTAKGGAFYICNILSRDEVAEGMGEPIPVHTWTDSEDFAAVAVDSGGGADGNPVCEREGVAGGDPYH